MIYVDKPVWTKAGTKNPRKKYAHLVSTSLEELHTFAEAVGIKRHFFHNKLKHPHYDITEEQWKIVVQSGAQIINSRDIIKIISA